ncbi:MAG: hypothetical protein ABSC93_31005, partial [Bryobacteraceae bacterium]
CPAGNWDHNCAVINTTSTTEGVPANLSGSMNDYNLTTGNIIPPETIWFVDTQNTNNGGYDGQNADMYTIMDSAFSSEVGGWQVGAYTLSGALAYPSGPSGKCDWKQSTGYPGTPTCPYGIAAIFDTQSKSFYNDQEYGIYMDVTKTVDGTSAGIPWVFYYSAETNAPGQQTSPLVQFADIQECSGCGPELVFDFFMLPDKNTGYYDFQVVIYNTKNGIPGAMATCKIMVSSEINTGTLGAAGPCQYTLPIQTWWSVSGMYNGPNYLAITTQATINNPLTYANASDAGLYINGLWLGTGFGQ